MGLVALALIIPFLISSGGGDSDQPSGGGGGGRPNVGGTVPQSTRVPSRTGGPVRTTTTVRTATTQTSTPSPTPSPPTTLPSSSQPVVGELRLELRYADGSPVLDSFAELYEQQADINGDPILGDSLGGVSSGSSGAIHFEEPPGRYIVIFSSIRGPRFRPDVDRPGIANLNIEAGQVTAVPVTLGRVIVALTDEQGQASRGEACVNVRAPDESTYRVNCVSTNDLGRVRLDLLAGDYILRYGWGAWGSTVGPISIGEGQAFEVRCVTYSPVDPFPPEQAPRCS